MALRGAGLERRLTQSEELDLLLASRYAGKGAAKLHPAIENLSTTFTRQNEELHLRRLVDRVLPYVLPEAEAGSQALKIVVRELIACTVLYPVMDMISDPDFWNRTIDQVVRTHCLVLLTQTDPPLIGRCCYSPAVRLHLDIVYVPPFLTCLFQKTDHQSPKHLGSAISASDDDSPSHSF